jgi:hypothetical protein
MSPWSSLPQHGCLGYPSVCYYLSPIDSNVHDVSHNLDPPDSITIAEFVSNALYGRYPIAQARNPFTCGISGKTRTTQEVLQREEYMARAMAKRLGYSLNIGSEWDRVVGLFSLNTVCGLVSSLL